MTYSVDVTKGYNGWNARSIVSIGQTLEGERVLELNTYKNRGGIAAQASVFIYKIDGSKCTEIFGDYSKNGIAQTPCKRVTEKAVRQVHDAALLQLDKIKEEALAFYEKKDKSAA